MAAAAARFRVRAQEARGEEQQKKKGKERRKKRVSQSIKQINRESEGKQEN